MVAFELEVIAAMSPVSSGIVLDSQYGAAQAIAADANAPAYGLLAAVEKTD